MPTDTVSNEKSSEIHNYWIEMYWPHADRDLSKLPVWFHEKKIKKDQIMKDGDLVLFYEVRHNPSSSYLGARTIFASGEVLSDKQNIPAEQQLRGGKKWLFTRATRPRFSVLPTHGIPVKKVKTILKIKGWPQQGFSITKEKFEKIENELRMN